MQKTLYISYLFLAYSLYNTVFMGEKAQQSKHQWEYTVKVPYKADQKTVQTIILDWVANTHAYFEEDHFQDLL